MEANTAFLLGLVLNDALYLNLIGTDFIKPPNPGMVAIIPANSTGPKIDERVRNHKEKLRKWQETTRSTDQALQQQLIAVFGEEFLRCLRLFRRHHIINVRPSLRKLRRYHSRGY